MMDLKSIRSKITKNIEGLLLKYILTLVKLKKLERKKLLINFPLANPILTVYTVSG